MIHLIPALVLGLFAVGVIAFVKKDDREIEAEYAAYRAYVHDCLHDN